MQEIELRKCPFCHNNDLSHVEQITGLHYIECNRCGASPHRLGAWSYEAAAKKWNGEHVNEPEANGCWITCEMCANKTCPSPEVTNNDERR